jgi:hypothetical protein
VAIHLKHRRSVDLGWFTPRDFGSPQGLAQRLQDRGVRFTTSRLDEGTLHGGASGISVSFLRYPYRLLDRTVRSEFGCQLASIRDLAAMKLAAIASRGAKKDFVDVFALGNVRSLARMLGDYRKKYAVAEVAHLLCALVYFDDADRQVTPPMLIRANWGTVKKTIRQWVKELAP